MKRSILPRSRNVLFATLLWVGNSQDVLSAQEEYRSGDYVIRPAVCWTTVMEFYDRGAFPYYSVDGYFFDANPFQTTRMLDGNRSMIMRSSKGRWLTDVTGRYRWTDARIRVDCFIREYFGGLVQQPYATVALPWSLPRNSPIRRHGSSFFGSRENPEST